MFNVLPPAPPLEGAGIDAIESSIRASSSPKRNSGNNNNSGNRRWQRVEVKSDSFTVPCQRSLHSGTIWRDNMIIFGGYDGHQRVNDLHFYNFTSCKWTQINSANSPSPRDRHIAVVYENELFIFGGFDGSSRVNDMHAFHLETLQWRVSLPLSGTPPTPRHSHAAIVYDHSMYIFSGYDGSYRNDFHRFDFLTSTWHQISDASGETPRARYRGTCVTYGSKMILHGGHDGNRHLQDTYIYDFDLNHWGALLTEGPVPSPRDSHIAIVYKNSMYIYGGSTGNAIGDFHELKLDTKRWGIVQSGISPQSAMIDPLSPRNNSNELNPGSRFCHVGVLHSSSLYIFGGYDGTHRLNDFLFYSFINEVTYIECPPSTLVPDLKKFVDNPILSDIVFRVEDVLIRGHKILCMRCPYFYNMLTGEYMESKATEIVIEDVKHSVFLQLLEYLYSDHVDVTLDSSMELLHTADRFGVDRLKRMCENVMLSSISIESVSGILLAADQHNADNLREHCIQYMLNNFDEVTKTAAFEEMGKIKMELVFELLKRR